MPDGNQPYVYIDRWRPDPWVSEFLRDFEKLQRHLLVDDFASADVVLRVYSHSDEDYLGWGGLAPTLREQGIVPVSLLVGFFKDQPDEANLATTIALPEPPDLGEQVIEAVARVQAIWEQETRKRERRSAQLDRLPRDIQSTDSAYLIDRRPPDPYELCKWFGVVVSIVGYRRFVEISVVGSNGGSLSSAHATPTGANVENADLVAAYVRLLRLDFPDASDERLHEAATKSIEWDQDEAATSVTAALDQADELIEILRQA